jgi:hypothetical protein
MKKSSWLVLGGFVGVLCLVWWYFNRKSDDIIHIKSPSLLRFTLTMPTGNIVTVKGVAAHDERIVLFSREFEPDQTKQIAMPFLGKIKLISSQKIRTQVVPITPKIAPEIAEFYEFIRDFAYRFTSLKTGVYSSKNNKFQIEILDNAPSCARVFFEKGNIEVDRKVFANFSAQARIFILLHEYAHFYTQSDNEEQADEQAKQWYLAAGFSAYEAGMAMVELAEKKAHIEGTFKKKENQIQAVHTRAQILAERLPKLDNAPKDIFFELYGI